MPNLLSTLRYWANKIASGGHWNYSGSAGFWYLSLGNNRSNSCDAIGICPAELMELVQDAEEAQGLRIERDALFARVAELENNNFTEA